MSVVPPHQTSGPHDLVAASAIIEDIGSMNLGKEMAGFPLMDLPHELVIEIFQFAGVVHGGQANAVCPLFLGKICRSWRAVVFETCKFWQEVNLILNSHCATQIFLLEEWTARAGGLPLSISIVGPKNILKIEASEEDIARLFDLIQDLSPQTHSLALETPVFFYDRWRDRGLANCSWPLLSNLLLSTNMGSSELSDPSHKLDFLSCPVLTSTTIKSFYHFYIFLPWRSLLHICFDSVFCSELYTALKSCPLLQTLEAHGIIEDDNFSASANTIDHHSLNQLTFELDENQDDCGQCCRLLNSLRPPELRTLVLKLALSLPTSGFQFDIYPCISQSGCQLSELTIEGASLEEKVFVDCLRLLPTLHTLQLSEIAWLNAQADFIGLGPTSLSLLMAAGPDGLLMLPNLRALSLMRSSVEFSGELVFELLASRWDKVEGDDGALATLQSVTIIPERGHPSLWEVSKDQDAVLENWRRRGYIVKVQ
ncbi:hypothetical protein DFP72DRAFT_405899 [Ephemerocybe angulata]|uniref:F-box domain-containing protein n=1 Tax=Ephemerocybe angulata TaxID=980116 RepID=A0A8H6HUD3_9AGAR|nr:hypothetical protein DFP72DRAFT_405899 [Tulosesus angulatus]